MIKGYGLGTASSPHHQPKLPQGLSTIPLGPSICGGKSLLQLFGVDSLGLKSLGFGVNPVDPEKTLNPRPWMRLENPPHPRQQGPACPVWAFRERRHPPLEASIVGCLLWGSPEQGITAAEKMNPEP